MEQAVVSGVGPIAQFEDYVLHMSGGYTITSENSISALLIRDTFGKNFRTNDWCSSDGLELRKDGEMIFLNLREVCLLHYALTKILGADIDKPYSEALAALLEIYK